MPSRSGEVVEKAGKFLQERLHELEQERARIERALAELTGGRIGSRTAGRTTKKRAGGRKRAGKKAAPRRRGGNTRAAQALKLVQASPGINASEIARKMKINPNYVYRVMAQLEKEKKVKKAGRKYSAA